MVHSQPREPTRAANDTALPLWPTFMLGNAWQAQRAQWEAFSAWQQTLLTFNKDFWEQWACRFAGGLPIDG